MKNYLSTLTSFALDLVFPIRCAGCNKNGPILCGGCTEKLPKLRLPYCKICASPNTLSPCSWCREYPLSVDGIRAPYLMDGAIIEAVHSFKYRGVQAAAPELGRLLARYWTEHQVPGKVIVPVPLHRSRLRDRGYNQAASLARVMAKLTGIALEDGLLKRTKDAQPQVHAASPSERRSNVEGSFRCMTEVTGRSVILVDDVATTGSTLSACAAALKTRGASSVWGLVLAREE